MPRQPSRHQTPRQGRAANQSTATSARPPITPKLRRNPGANLTTRRKRRRSPASLTVNNVFNSANTPSSCLKFWQWPVTSWYFGEVTTADLQYTTDHPFNTTPTETQNETQNETQDETQNGTQNGATNDTSDNTQPDVPTTNSQIPVNYRLQWLYEDAAMYTNGVVPNAPRPIESLSAMRNKEPNACARPSPFLDPNGSVGESSAQPRGRLRSRTRARANSTLANETQSTRLRKRRRSEPGLADPDVPHMPLAAVLRPRPDVTSLPLPPLLPEETLASLCETTHPAFNHENPLGAYMKPADGSRPMSFQNFDPTHVACPTTAYPPKYSPCTIPPPTKTDAKVESKAVTLVQAPAPSHVCNDVDDDGGGGGDVLPEAPRKKVCLQFVSEKEPSVMASIHYTIPDRLQMKQNDSDALQQVKLHRMDVSFRDAKTLPCDGFDDEYEADGLSQELERARADLDLLVEETRPLRTIAKKAIMSELDEQKDLAEMVTQEKNIVARLAEIQKEKAEAVRAKTAEEKSRSARARRASARNRGGTARRRRGGSQANSCSGRSSDVDAGSSVKNGAREVKSRDDSHHATDHEDSPLTVPSSSVDTLVKSDVRDGRGNGRDVLREKLGNAIDQNRPRGQRRVKRTQGGMDGIIAQAVDRESDFDDVETPEMARGVKVGECRNGLDAQSPVSPLQAATDDGELAAVSKNVLGGSCDGGDGANVEE